MITASPMEDRTPRTSQRFTAIAQAATLKILNEFQFLVCARQRERIATSPGRSHHRSGLWNTEWIRFAKAKKWPSRQWVSSCVARFSFQVKLSDSTHTDSGTN